MVRTGRTTHAHDGDVVVFLIGMRINSPWRVRAWLPVLLAMPGVLRELAAHPEHGALGARTCLGAGGPFVVQYWRDAESLHAYAHLDGGLHRRAWQRFNARARAARGAVGIWHETYAVPAGHHESVYVDTPPLGLAAATRSVPVARGRERADQRMRLRGAHDHPREGASA
ncbi:DUF4188 domain-containing protein [Kineococcus indalonis]|uniref:DUF4188 domain-containing protein n=1 Tax=Kineococcus indalonis TaxID=2696566 RepID=UPI00141211FE|nr:DUF4188 domain-containing protein [Kineococcus indalonis]NAZ85582.1 DUF4188 domain-containing protein [Kineococcus indalonis]